MKEACSIVNRALWNRYPKDLNALLIAGSDRDSDEVKERSVKGYQWPETECSLTGGKGE